MTTTRNCRRCGLLPRWKTEENDWCRACVWEFCCSRYPREVHGEMRLYCIHRSSRDHKPFEILRKKMLEEQRDGTR